jgi:Xaa-Pro aminopeptidase
MSIFAERRAELVRRMGSRTAAVLPAAPLAIRNNDVEHEYRQDSDLYYLTGLDEPESVLVLAPEHATQKVVLFVRPRDPERETWDGPRIGVDGAVADFGADAAFPIAELAQRLPEYLEGHERLVYRLGRDRKFDDLLLSALEATRVKTRRGGRAPQSLLDPAPFVHEMRLRKDGHEVATMKRAAEITREAHLMAMRAAVPGRYEYEVEAILSEVFRRNGSERPAYGSIVGAGKNATVLHYRKNDKRLEAGELLLIDAGCELGYYASDVTRTFPVSGKFSAPQRAIYEIVLAANQAGIDAVQPGTNLDAIHDRCVDVVVDGLTALGLLREERSKIMEERLYRKFFMHRTSHWLGMDVHDVGAYYDGKTPRPLEPGMVLTVEPGIYVRENEESVPPEYRGIGVRIEDDVLVTQGGFENLTLAIPKTVVDVERAAAR